MPTPTYDLISTVTIASATPDVTFSSIPQTYRDLIVVHNNFGTVNNDSNSNFRFNGDTGSNYTRRYAFFEAGIATGTDGGTSLPVFGLRTTIGTSISQIMSYSATDRPKTILTRSNTPNHLTWMSSGRWANNAAITAIQLNASGGNFAVGSVISLYGIVA